MVLPTRTLQPTPLPGTPIVIPTLGTPTPYPTAYVLQPPADFYVGDAVFVGTSASENGVRLRLLAVQTIPHGGEAVVTWSLEVLNIGLEEYLVFPTAQMYLSAMQTTLGTETGVWPATREAADAIGVPFDPDVYALTPGMMRVFDFAAFAPAGDAAGFTFQLDPTVSEGSPVVTWVNQTNPYCAGDIAIP